MHDGHGNNCYGSAYTTSIMATIVQSSFNHYWWSECSKTKMAQVIGYMFYLSRQRTNTRVFRILIPVFKYSSVFSLFDINYAPRRESI